jgi:hypothetical protein
MLSFIGLAGGAVGVGAGFAGCSAHPSSKIAKIKASSVNLVLTFNTPGPFGFLGLYS